MGARTLFRRCIQASSKKTSIVNKLARSDSKLTAILATIPAALLMVSSAGFGCSYAFAQGMNYGPPVAAFAVAMALGLELAKPFAIESVFTCLRSWAFGRAMAMALLGTVAVAYSLTAELSLMATMRGDAVAQRMMASNTAKDDRAELARLIAERAAMRFTLATAETVTAAREAVAAAERARKAECGGGRGPKCRAREADEGAARTALAKAIADLAATERAKALEVRADTIRARLAKRPAMDAADPGAAALANYLALFGATVPASILAEWLVLIGVVALETGSGLAVVLARALSDLPSERKAVPEKAFASERHTEGQPGPRESASEPVGSGDPSLWPNPNKPTKRTRSKPAKRTRRDPARRLGNVVRLIRENGGKLTTSQQALANRLRVSKTRVHELLRELESAGHVELTTSREGTTVRLVA